MNYHRILLEAGADIHKAKALYCALYLASLYGQLEMVELLLEAGANKE